MYISEYTDSGYLQGGMTLGSEPSFDQAPVTFTSTAGQSAAFKNNTRMVRIAVDGVASIVFGTNPTAVISTQKRLSAGQSEYFLVPLGQAYKVSAVITTV